MPSEKTLADVKGKKLLVLAGVDPHRKIVEAAHELGVYVIVADYLAIEDATAKQIADESWDVDVFDTDEIVRRCREAGVDGVLNFCSDAPQRPYQIICEELGLPCFGTRRQFEVLSDKAVFKEFCAEHGLKTVPKYTVEQARSGEAPYPLLVKPSDGRGSRGQTICRRSSDLERALREARAFSHDGRAIVEKYMEGYQDFGSSYFIVDGQPYLVKVGDRFLGRAADGLERQQILNISPTTQIERYLERTDPLVKRFAAELGLRFGGLFLQGFIDDGEVYYYDPGLRMPGSDFDVMVRNVTGFDSMKSAVLFALTGDVASCVGDPHEAFRLGGGVGVILALDVRAGTIGEIRGLDVLAADERVHAISERHVAGDVVRATGDVGQRAIEIIAHIPSRDDLADLFAFALSTVDILDTDGRDMLVSTPAVEGGRIVIR